MDWNRFAVLGSQVVVFIGLCSLVGVGHNSYITDALLAVAGSLAGVGVYEQFRRK